MTKRKRKAFSKKLRFEVFKRDHFKCQYCGSSAPDALLEVDHIDPVANGGPDDIVNLITACFDCNRGKGDRRLDDKSAVVKQSEQLRQLAERRDQLELMLKWKTDLMQHKKDVVSLAVDHWQSITGYEATKKGEQSLRGTIRQFGVDQTIDAMDDAFDAYVKFNADGTAIRESVERAFVSIRGICRINKMAVEEPHIKDLYYIRGILRNRVNVNEGECMSLLRNAAKAGVKINRIAEAAKCESSWSNFRYALHLLVEELEG